MQGRVADILSTRLAEATAYQMLDQAQGYFDLADYDLVVGLAWYSDAPGQWNCAVKHGPEETEESARQDQLFVIEADDREQLEEALRQELSGVLHD